MSAENDEEKSRCANCGASEGEDIKLKTCTGCKSVKYCGVKCQKEHRPKHKRSCKKGAAELYDEILFKQPECSHLGDCPICFLPLPVGVDEGSPTLHCCSKTLCFACHYSNVKREREEGTDHVCPFCRAPKPENCQELEDGWRDRAESNDPPAIRELGTKHQENGDYRNAFKYFSKSAALGDTTAIADLGMMYMNGQGVERDVSKAINLLEKASIAGHPVARCYVGGFDWNNGRKERAVKHWKISSKLGDIQSMSYLEMACDFGFINKDDFAAALREHQAAVEAMKSPMRTFVAEMFDSLEREDY